MTHLDYWRQYFLTKHMGSLAEINYYDTDHLKDTLWIKNETANDLSIQR